MAFFYDLNGVTSAGTHRLPGAKKGVERMAKSLQEVLEEHGVETDDLDIEGIETELRESFGPKALRKQLEEALPKAKRADDLEKEVASLKKGPVREKAFEEYGVVLEDLKPAEKEALEKFEWEGDEPTEEELSKFVEKYDLPVEAQEEEEEIPASGKIGEQVRRSDGATSKTKITPEAASKWSAESFVRFEKEFPEQAKQLLNGEDVVAAFSP